MYSSGSEQRILAIIEKKLASKPWGIEAETNGVCQLGYIFSGSEKFNTSIYKMLFRLLITFQRMTGIGLAWVKTIASGDFYDYFYT